MISKMTNEERDMFRRLDVKEPKFYEYCLKQRKKLRDDLEQGGGDLHRGQATLLREFLAALKPPTR